MAPRPGPWALQKRAEKQKRYGEALDSADFVAKDWRDDIPDTYFPTDKFFAYMGRVYSAIQCGQWDAVVNIAVQKGILPKNPKMKAVGLVDLATWMKKPETADEIAKYLHDEKAKKKKQTQKLPGINREGLFADYQERCEWERKRALDNIKEEEGEEDKQRKRPRTLEPRKEGSCSRLVDSYPLLAKYQELTQSQLTEQCWARYVAAAVEAGTPIPSRTEQNLAESLELFAEETKQQHREKFLSDDSIGSELERYAMEEILKIPPKQESRA